MNNHKYLGGPAISFQCRCGIAHRSLTGLLTHIIRTHDGPLYDAAVRRYNAMYGVGLEATGIVGIEVGALRRDLILQVGKA